MSLTNFWKGAIKNYKQIGTFVPSSRFLGRMMAKKDFIDKSDVIVELGAGTGAITKEIINNLDENNSKKVFIFEKDNDMYEKLKEIQVPKNVYLLKEDVLNINEVLNSYGVDKVDLVISALPFRSLPENIYKFIMEDFFSKFLAKNGHLIQLSYFKSSMKLFEKYFENVEIERCLLNIPPMACVYDCWNYKEKH